MGRVFGREHSTLFIHSLQSRRPMSEASSITINGQSYEVSPLRCKHLRTITEMLTRPQPSALWASLERWLPYIKDSIVVKNPQFKESELDEMTIEELNSARLTILQVSGIILVDKQPGEVKPTDSTGMTSTQESPSPSVGTTA